MKIVLAFPCQKRYINDPSMSILPIGLLSLGAVLQEAGHEVQLIHLARFTVKDGIRLIQSEDPDLIGLSCFSFQRQRTLQLADKLAEKSDCPIVIGGPHAAPLANEILELHSSIKGVVIGEGERTFVDLVKRLEQGQSPAHLAGLLWREGDEILLGKPVDLIEDLDSLPSVPATELNIMGVEKLYQRRHLLASRGCSARCIFCRAPEAWGRRVRRHSVARVLADVDVLRHKYGLLHVSFRDDTFTDDKDWTRKLCAGLKERKILWDCQSRVTALDYDLVKEMRSAGCVQVQLGVESGSDKILAYLKKPFNVVRASETISHCRQVGLAFSLYVIVGVPEESKGDLKATERLIRDARPASLSVSRLAHYPGTPLSEGLSSAEWFKDERESIFLRDDKAALNAEKRMLRLAEEMAQTEPFTVEELKEAGELLAWPPTARLALARLYCNLGLDEESLDEYELLCNEDPGFLWAQMEYGDLLLEVGYTEDAREHLQAAVDAVPNWPYALDRLGWTYCLLGEEQKGEELKTKAAMLEPFVDPPPPPG